jgi:phage gp36-like protein
MAWQTVTDSDIVTRLAGAEIDALRETALADDQSDPVPEIVDQVVEEVRGYVAAGGYTLGAGATIPGKLLSAALAICRFRAATRLPTEAFLTESRKTEYRDAVRLLERVADGKFAIEEPAEASDETSSGPSPSFETPSNVFQPSNQDGL